MRKKPILLRSLEKSNPNPLTEVGLATALLLIELFPRNGNVYFALLPP
jgi:hypothetical protein